MRTQRYFGKLTFPSSENTVIENVWLSFENDTLLIELPFHNLLNDQDDKRINVVWGEFKGLGKISLFNCYMDDGQSSVGGILRKLKCHYSVNGEFFANSSELKSKRFRFYSDTLNEWLPRGIGIQQINDATITFDDIDNKIHFKIKEGTISISRKHIVTGSNFHREIDNQAVIDFEFQSDKCYISIWPLLFRFKKLILFLTDKNPHFQKLYIGASNEMYREISGPNIPLNSPFELGNLSLIYFDFEMDPSIAFESWMKNDSIEPITDFLLEKSFNFNQTIHSYFFSMCAALEGFHGLFFKSGTKKEKEKIGRKEREIFLNHLPEELKSEFKEKTKDWTKLSLRDKINDYKELFEEISSSLIKNDWDTFATKIITSRNYIAHQADANSSKGFKENELIETGKAIEFVLRIKLIEYLKWDIKNPERFIEQAKNDIDYMSSRN